MVRQTERHIEQETEESIIAVICKANAHSKDNFNNKAVTETVEVYCYLQAHSNRWVHLVQVSIKLRL